jgi:hypothetical protein
VNRKISAMIGPRMAPEVSIALWNPKAFPTVSGCVDSAIIASLGGLRTPLPILSTTLAATY